MIAYMRWFIIIFIFGWVLSLVGGVLGWVYRKPGVTMSVFIDGYPDEPVDNGLSQSKRMLSYVRDDKRKLVFWVIFVAEFLLMADIVAILVFVLAVY